MNTPSYRAVFEHLESTGHLPVEARAEAETAVLASTGGDDSASKLISVVAGVGAWLTTLFLVLALFAFGLVDIGKASSLVAAVLLGVIAVVIDRLDLDRNVFISQIVLATSFAAQALALVGMDRLDEPIRLLGAAAFCGSMYVLVSSTANRLFSAALLAGNLAIETVENQAGFMLLFGAALILPCAVFGARQALPSRIRLAVRPAAYIGATLALVLSFEALGGEVAEWIPMAQHITLAVASVCLLALAHLQAKRQQSKRQQSSRQQSNQRADEHRFVWTAGAVILLGLVTSPGILCAALVVGVGLWRHRSWLTGLGALGLATHLFAYYYQLDVTLLEKSGVLVASGLVLLGLRWVLERHDEASLDEASLDEKEAR